MFARPFLLSIALLLWACATDVVAQEPALPGGTSADAAPGVTSFLIENVTRVELWRFFAPFPEGGDEPDYLFGGNRAVLGVHYDGPRWALRGAIQYVRVENLPRGAIGPGLLGNGGAYFFQAAGTFSYQFYLRALSVAFRDPSRRLSIEVGRLSFMPEPMAGPVDPAESLAQERLAGRLLGDMDGSLYERAWDGGRVQVRRGAWLWSAAAAVPTQGTFEESANLPIDRLAVAALDVTAAPGALLERTRFQAFAIGYRDTRDVHARPDNSDMPATAADVSIGTVGVSATGVYPAGGGAWELTASAAGQFGDWYGQSHRAMSALVEAGYRWREAPGRPLVRAGAIYASGDGDGDDDRHGTFFTMLPSGDRYVRSNTYALMNAVDVWGEARLEPHRDLHLLAAVHHVALASSADRWYSGSGATERRGNYFGYQGRDTAGAGTLGWITEGEVVWQPVRWWTVSAYAAHFAGGDAVATLFADPRLFTATLVSRFSF